MHSARSSHQRLSQPLRVEAHSGGQWVSRLARHRGPSQRLQPPDVRVKPLEQQLLQISVAARALGVEPVQLPVAPDHPARQPHRPAGAVQLLVHRRRRAQPASLRRRHQAGHSCAGHYKVGQTSAKPGLCSTYSIRTPAGPRRKTANVFGASLTSSISTPRRSASRCTSSAESTSSAMWFSSGRSPSSVSPSTIRSSRSATPSAPFRRSKPMSSSPYSAASRSGRRRTTWSRSKSVPPRSTSTIGTPFGASSTALPGWRRTPAACGRLDTALDRFPTRSPIRSSAPRCRRPSASNSVSFPSLASTPTSVKVSVSSIACIPRCSHRKPASSSRRSTQRATWSRLVGRICCVIPARFPAPVAPESCRGLQPLDVGGVELDRLRRHVLLEVLDRRRARDRQHHRRARQQPGERELPRRRVVPPSQVVEGTARAGEVADREGEPRDEADPVPLARLEQALGMPVGQVVAVLDGHHVDHRARSLELLGGHVRDADVADLALVLKLLQRSQRILERPLRVGRVQLVQVDPLEPQPPQARLAALLQPLRPPVARPLPGAAP